MENNNQVSQEVLDKLAKCNRTERYLEEILHGVTLPKPRDIHELRHALNGMLIQLQQEITGERLRNFQKYIIAYCDGEPESEECYAALDIMKLLFRANKGANKEVDGQRFIHVILVQEEWVKVAKILSKKTNFLSYEHQEYFF